MSESVEDFVHEMRIVALRGGPDAALIRKAADTLVFYVDEVIATKPYLRSAWHPEPMPGLETSGSWDKP